MKEEAELKDLTVIKRLLALFKRKGAKHLDIALTDRQHIELVNILDALGLLDDPDTKWLVELDRRRAERLTVLSLDELTRLALSLSEQDVGILLNQYKKKIKRISF
ncbi:MAG: hypothetical protein Q6351_004775 [Candidatus Njordarchaeum guaymaensis]